MAVFETPVVHVMTLGRSANQMIQFMVAKAIADGVPGCRISNVELADWNIYRRRVGQPGDGRATRIDGQAVPIAALADSLRSGAITRVDLAAYGQRMEHFQSVDTYREMFKSPGLAVSGGDAETLVISIRGGDILDGHHPDYVLLPIEFYRHVIETTGLRPLFFGQLSDNPYMDRLRDAFPGAEYRCGTTPLEDFEFIRRSRHILLSVSTFSWLAAWLSHAETIIFPVCGLLSPFQDRSIDLLPLDDPRYRFFLFPVTYAIPVERIAEAHGPLAGLWREVSAPMLRILRDDSPRFPDPPDFLLPPYFEADYLARYPDIKQAVQDGHFPHGFDHFQRFGPAEGRTGLEFDRKWYSRTYPLAAYEVGQGDYTDLYAHYLSIGRKRGYLPIDLALASQAAPAELTMPYYTGFSPDMLFHEVRPPGSDGSAPALCFHRLRQVFVVGDGLVFDGSLRLFKETVHQASLGQIEAAFARLRQEIEEKRFKMHGGPSLLCGKAGIDGRARWLVEVLPLAYVSREQIEREGWTVVIPQVYPWMANVVSDVLGLAGVTPPHCMLNEGEAAFFEELIVISGLTEDVLRELQGPDFMALATAPAVDVCELVGEQE